MVGVECLLPHTLHPTTGTHRVKEPACVCGLSVLREASVTQFNTSQFYVCGLYVAWVHGEASLHLPVCGMCTMPRVLAHIDKLQV